MTADKQDRSLQSLFDPDPTTKEQALKGLQVVDDYFDYQCFYNGKQIPAWVWGYIGKLKREIESWNEEKGEVAEQ